MNKIVQFHIDNNYYVKVKPLTNMIGCLATFPANFLLKKTEFNRTYIIDTNPYSIEIYDVEKSNVKTHIIKVNKVSIRLLILEDILLRTLARKMSQELILVEEKDKNIFDILNMDLNQEEIELEKELCIKFRNLILGKVDHELHMKDNKIADGYNDVLNCFENGGL